MPNYKFLVIINGIDIKYYKYATDIVKDFKIPRATIYWKLNNEDAYKQRHKHLTIERCDLPIVKNETKIIENYTYAQTVFEEVAV